MIVIYIKNKTDNSQYNYVSFRYYFTFLNIPKILIFLYSSIQSFKSLSRTNKNKVS